MSVKILSHLGEVPISVLIQVTFSVWGKLGGNPQIYPPMWKVDVSLHFTFCGLPNKSIQVRWETKPIYQLSSGWRKYSEATWMSSKTFWSGRLLAAGLGNPLSGNWWQLDFSFRSFTSYQKAFVTSPVQPLTLFDFPLLVWLVGTCHTWPLKSHESRCEWLLNCL